jgi:uncharacterized membrane protein YgdD (TMEM256/DUF423 family)
MTAVIQPVAAWSWLALAAALLGFSAVLLGAAGSHAVDLSDAAAAQRWTTALQIHYFQAAALMALAALAAAQAGSHPAAISSAQQATKAGAKSLLLPGYLQLLGTVLFCGSLYLRALQIDWLPGWITPMSGLILLAGWLLLIGVLMRLVFAKVR